ncbi:glutamate--cysteine ligase [Agromyces allii]|uniref:Putative glutamate--cysteine ligase 2 n=2 Tax=Agromyces allii TaxID=393607 RepID=A0ABN2QUA3_9MICO
MRTVPEPSPANDPAPEVEASRASARAVTTFGIEEEFVLLDPVTLRPVPLAPQAIAALHAAGFAGATSEFLASQVEIATGVCTDGAEAVQQLEAFRAALDGIAVALGVHAASTGTPFDAGRAPTVTPEARYSHIQHDIGAMIDDHQVCGLHVHVGIDDREDRVRVLNGLRAWIPMLTALAANSPYWRTADTGFASWRTIVLRRWTTAGIPAPFADADDYERRIDDLVGIGATRDRPLIAWLLRASHHLPTVELRVADAQLDAADSVTIALLCRRIADGILSGARAARATDAGGVTDAAAAASAQVVPFSGEVLDAAVWAAARDGFAATVPDPVQGRMAPLAEVVASALAMHDADDGCPEAVAALLARGSGAERQRAAFAAGGRSGLARCAAASVG